MKSPSDMNPGDMKPDEVEAMLRGVEGALEREEGPLAWLRSRPTWLLRALVVASALPVAGYLYAVHGLRPDAASYPAFKLLEVVFGLGAAATWSIHLATRPLHRPQPSAEARVVWTLASLGAALLVAAHAVPQVAPLVFGDPFLNGLLCYLWCLYLGTPVLVAGVLFNRHPSPTRVLLAAAAAGLVASIEMELHCATTDRLHVVSSHATAGLTLAVAVLVAAGLGAAVRAAARPSPRG